MYSEPGPRIDEPKAREVLETIRRAFGVGSDDDYGWDEWREEGWSFNWMVEHSPTTVYAVGLTMSEMLRKPPEPLLDYFYECLLRFFCPLKRDRLQRGRLWRQGELNVEAIRAHLEAERDEWIEREAEERLAVLNREQADAILAWLNEVAEWPEAGQHDRLDAVVLGGIAYWSLRAEGKIGDEAQEPPYRGGEGKRKAKKREER